MDADILYLWSLNKTNLILLNVFLLLFVIIYCLNKITNYNRILPLKKNKLYSYLIFILIGGVYVLISYMFLQPIIVYPFGVLMLCVLTKLAYVVSWKNALFFANDFTLLPLLSSYIVTNALAVLMNTPVQETPEYWISVESIISFFLAVLISYYINFKKIEVEYWNNFLHNNRYSKTLILIQIYIIVTISISSVSYDKYLTIWFSRVMLFMLICTLGIYLTILDYVVRASSITIYEMNNKILEDQVQFQIENYNSQAKYISEIRKFKHDFLPLINTINNLIEENQIEETKTILSQTKHISEVYFNMHKEFSNNLFVQAILNNAYHEAIENGISFHAKVFIPKELNMKEIDMCRIFSNLKKNSIEACCNVNKKKLISIKGTVKDNWFILTVENTFSGEIKELDGELVTIKDNPDCHGLGLKIIKETVEKYGGVMKVEWNESLFITKLYIHYSSDRNL